MHLRTFNLAFPSAALPASGSMGIISARIIKAPLTLSVLRKDDAKVTSKNLNLQTAVNIYHIIAVENLILAK